MIQTQPEHNKAPAGVLDRLHERLRGLDDNADRAALARVHSRCLMLLGFLELLKHTVCDKNRVEVDEIIKYLEVK